MRWREHPSCTRHRRPLHGYWPTGIDRSMLSWRARVCPARCFIAHVPRESPSPNTTARLSCRSWLRALTGQGRRASTPPRRDPRNLLLPHLRALRTSTPFRESQSKRADAAEECWEFPAPPPPRTPALDPFPGVTIEVRNGELWAASPYLSLGYLVPDHEGAPSPQAAARFIRGADSGATSTTGPFRCDDSGFATVGDRAEITPDGRYRILGRGDASITVSGTTVIAEDVERVIAEFPGVYAAAVVAVADPVHGDVPVAVVEGVHRPDPGHTATLATAWVEQAHARLGAPARARAWYLIEKLPRTASGKIARGQVIDALHGSGSTNLPAAKTRIETVNTEDPAPKGQPTTTPPGLIPLCEAPGEDPALVPRTQMLIPICEAPRLNGHPLTLERIDRP